MGTLVQDKQPGKVTPYFDKPTLSCLGAQIEEGQTQGQKPCHFCSRGSKTAGAGDTITLLIYNMCRIHTG